MLKAAPKSNSEPSARVTRRTGTADQNGGDARVHVLGLWAHSVSPWGRGSLHADQLRGADRRQRDVHHES